MVSLIGGHFTRNGIERDYPCRVVLSLNGNGLDEQHPDTIILFRDTTVYNDGPSDLHHHPLRRTIEYARWWYSDRDDGPTLRQVWMANQHRAHFFTITNEIGGNDPEHIQDHIAYEANICQLAAADGLRCAVGKLAGDSPGWPSGLWQQYYAPFIMQAWNRHGAIYARHVYGGNLVDGNGDPTTDPPGNPSRPFAEVAYLRSLGYGGGMVLAECGIDGGYGVADYGRFREQALGYAAALKPLADMVIGLCWWECGDTGFHADYTEHLQQLRPELDISLPKWTAGVPGGNYKSVVFKLAQEHTEDEWAGIARLAYREYMRTLTASHDNLVVMVGDGNEESYAVVFDPELPSQVATIQALQEAGLDYQTRNFRQPPPPPTGIDMAQYFYPPNNATHSDIFTLSNNWGQGPERCQLQRAGNVSYVTKNQQYEQRTVGDVSIALNLDTSPGGGEYYTVESSTGWMPRMWQPGQTFARQEVTRFYRKTDCAFLRQSNWATPLTFERIHATWTSQAGITLANVAELSWFANGRIDERYWFARGLGLVGWEKHDGKRSWVSEIIPRGSQQDNVRETGCWSA